MKKLELNPPDFRQVVRGILGRSLIYCKVNTNNHSVRVSQSAVELIWMWRERTGEPGRSPHKHKENLSTQSSTRFEPRTGGVAHCTTSHPVHCANLKCLFYSKFPFCLYKRKDFSSPKELSVNILRNTPHTFYKSCK